MDEGKSRASDAPGAWSEDDSRVFVEFGRVMVPGREEIEHTLLDLIPAGPDEPFLAVEIGTGAGWLSAAVLREFPKARVLGLDGSPDMLRAAAKELAPYGDRAELRRFRLEDPSWTDGSPPARVFLSSLVLHHLDGAGKRDLFALLFDRLEPGGALLFADVMAPRTERARRHFAAAWEDEIRRRSLQIHGDARAHEFFVRERWNVYDHPDPIDAPSTLPEQLRWMEEAGFEGVDAFWARAGHAVLGGYRPGAV
ncbi:MAG TPA: class I SAM-dependent methyltransferase [Rubrobacteraceae bacterium]|nr:class I SAM-dependent methyltransferase [Rubrobacteraceae bacterium]